MKFNECWNLFKAAEKLHLLQDPNYTTDELWCSMSFELAFDHWEKSMPSIDKERDYELMEEYVSPEQREYIDYLELNEKITEEVLEFHHIEPEPIPDWKVQVDKIEDCLKNS